MSRVTVNICAISCALMGGSLVFAQVPDVPETATLVSEGTGNSKDLAAPAASVSVVVAAPTPPAAAPSSATQKKPVKAKPGKPAKREEPEEEWVLLPESPKVASQSGSGAESSLGTQAAPVAADGAPALHATTTTADMQGADADSGGEQRLALVIGNGTYKLGRLPNSVNDAQSVASTLRRLGWKVIERENIGKDEMAKAAELSAGGVGLFYYAGHGIQSGNTNYLIPVDADIQDEDELPGHAYESSDVLHRMDQAGNRLNIVILDACRNNPFASRFSSTSKGLAGVQPGAGGTAMIISFATMPGATAADGTSGNGLYTSELLHAMSQKGLGVEEVFKQVRAEVKLKSGGKQIPYENSSLTGSFYFNPTPEQAAALPIVANNNGAAAPSGQSRAIVPVLVSRKVFANYQLSANLKLAGTLVVGKFSTDGGSFLAATQDRQLKVWNVATEATILSDPDFGAPTLSSNGRYLVGVPDSKIVHVLDTEAKAFAVKTYQVGGSVQLAEISPDGRRLLVFTKEKGFVLFNAENAALIGKPQRVDGNPQLAFAPSGNRVLIWGSQSDDLYLWDAETGKRIGRTSAHGKPVSLVRFSNDGNFMLTAASGDATILWRMSDGEMVRKLTLGDGNPAPVHAEFLADGKSIVLNIQKSTKVPDSGYVLGLWDIATGKPTTTLLPSMLAKSLRFSPDQQRLFVLASDNSTRVFEMQTKTQVDSLGGAELIGFSSDGRRFIAHDGDGVRLYDVRSLTPIARMPAQITAFVGPKARNLYATAAADGSVKLVDFERGDVVSVLQGHIDPVSNVIFAADGKQLMTFSDDKVPKLWALPAVKELGRLTKDSFESTSEYEKRISDWTSDYTALVKLGDYNADSESYTVKVGEFSISVPMARDDARQFSGQSEAILSGRLKFYDSEQLQLADSKIKPIP